MKKLFLCAGAAKAGTTWLYSAIRKNPALWFTPEKELNYFFSVHGRFDRLTPAIREKKLERVAEWAAGPGREAANPEARLDWYRRYAAGPVSDDWYRDLFAATPEGAWACDFSPSTSLLPDAGWEAVTRFAPEIRVVYILREPEARLWSHAKFHASYIGRFDAFRDMPLAEMERFIDRYSLTEDGDYGSHLVRMLKHVPRENVLLIKYDRIAKQPRNVLLEVEEHLGIQRTPIRLERLSERVNVSEEVKRPNGFGEAYRRQFAREMDSLVEQGVDFARPWAELHSRRPIGRVRRAARRLGL